MRRPTASQRSAPPRRADPRRRGDDTILGMSPDVLRILDANFNRAREALRVMEEYARFALDDAALTARIKASRHGLAEASRRLCPAESLDCRDTPGDVGTAVSTAAEMFRGAAEDVAAASIKRLQEALRVIEEYGKVIDAKAAAGVEKMRYEAYDLEQALSSAGPKRRQLRAARLHVLLTEKFCAGPWESVCRAALTGGADVIQLREKEMPDGALLERARRVRELTRKAGALLIVNDRADIARLSGADGVHLGAEDLPAAEARRIAGPSLLIGRTAHDAAEVRAASEDLGGRVDYVAVGPMFASATKPGLPAAGNKFLRGACAATDLPVVAIGGICAENVGALSAARPFAVAVCQGVIGAKDPRDAARRMVDRISGSCSNRAAS